MYIYELIHIKKIPDFISLSFARNLHILTYVSCTAYKNLVIRRISARGFREMASALIN